MKLRSPTLRLEVIWFDSDMLELRMSASNGGFSGEANFYAGLGEPAAFGNKIEGFPRSVNDVREYEFGGTSMQGYGGAKIRLHCKDSSGHVLVHVVVYMTPSHPSEVAESASIQIDVVPSAIDSFVAELQCMRNQIGDAAVLQGET